MADSKLSGQFSIGNERFVWTAKRYAGMTNADANYRGLSARVTLADGVYRELVIEFHPDDYSGRGPSSSRDFEARLVEYTQKAIDEGWRPDSRGKPFWIEAEKLMR